MMKFWNKIKAILKTELDRHRGMDAFVIVAAPW